MKRCFKSNLLSQTVVYKLLGLFMTDKNTCCDEFYQRHTNQIMFSRLFQRWRHEESYHHPAERLNFQAGFTFLLFFAHVVTQHKPKWEGAPWSAIQSTTPNSKDLPLNAGWSSCRGHYTKHAGLYFHCTALPLPRQMCHSDHEAVTQLLLNYGLCL